METTKEATQRSTPGGGEEKRAGDIVDGISEESLGRTSRNMGHVRVTEGEVLVTGIVPGHASVRNDL